MKPPILFCWVGRTAAEYARIGEAEYLERIRRYHPCRLLQVAQERHDGRYTAEHRLEREGRRLIDRLQQATGRAGAFAVALDPSGRQLSSRELAALVRRAAYERAQALAFVVGGPDGLSCSVRERADRLLSLSRMTLPHDMARLVLLEQVYRALSIVHGHPYDR